VNEPSLDEARECRSDEPYRALEIANCYIRQHPNRSDGYFSRHLTWQTLGDFEKSIADCSRSIELDPKLIHYMSRGRSHRGLGDHASAVRDFDNARSMDVGQWLTSFGPHFRADSLARLGRLDQALADCDLIRDDHWMPVHSGLPGGNKREFTAEIRRRAALASGQWVWESKGRSGQ
jgi:tetratricopeptide (TPR) repeat protein